jgi:TPR repeat protein
MLALRRQLSLDPEIVPAPPAISGGPPLEKIALRLCIVAAVAALGAWAAVSLSSNPSTGEIAQNGSAPAPVTTSVKLVHVSGAIAPPLPTAMALPTLPAALTTWNERQPRPETAALAPQQPSESQASANTVLLSADEIAMLLKRGKADLIDGDISAARLLLRRAAEAGNAEAELTLGSTFDPLVIAQLGAFGVQADAAKAREWYQKAAALGSNLAAEQLAKLVRAGE